MHHPTERITYTTAFVTPVVEHWLEREILKSNVVPTLDMFEHLSAGSGMDRGVASGMHRGVASGMDRGVASGWTGA